MDAYTSFAKVYDMFMDNVPYDEWGAFIVELLKEHGIDDGIILDLGCGTGSMTEYLAQQGYQMIGIDYSEEMLAIAREKAGVNQSDILYIQQDMREFELYGTVRAVVCICDSINYLLEPEEIQVVFKLVNNYLDPKGIFILDFNTHCKYEAMGECTIAEARDDASFIWDNYYYEEEEINEYELNLFLPEEDSAQGLYRRFTEIHHQRAYSLSFMKEMLAEAGMKYVTAYGDTLRRDPTDDSERIYLIGQEQRK